MINQSGPQLVLPEQLVFRHPHRQIQVWNFIWFIWNNNLWLIVALATGILTLYIIYSSLIKGKILSQYKKLNESKLSGSSSTTTTSNNTTTTTSARCDVEEPPSIWKQIIESIKIFGYLDDLTVKQLINNMYTTKLQKGEMFHLNQDQGLIVVLDGSFQIYSKVDKDIIINGDNNDEDDDDLIWLKHDNNKYQLLNVVKNGNPLSSLTDILQLFTDSDHKEDLLDLIARAASEDATLAIIPPESFKELSINHPKSASHLIQTILNRLYHVNLQITHSYLGLTNELFMIEKSLNNKHNYKLPFYLIKCVLQNFQNDELKKRKKRQASVPLNLDLSKGNHSLHNSFSSTFLVDRSQDTLSSESGDDSEYEQESPQNDDSILKLTIIENIFKFWNIERDTFDDNANLIENIPTHKHGLKIIPNKRFNKDLSIVSPSTSTSSDERDSSTEPSRLSPRTNSPISNYNIIKDEFAQCLNLDWFPKGTTIVEQNSNSKGLYYVISGEINVTISSPNQSANDHHIIYSVSTGGVAGYLSSLIGYRSFVNLIAHTDVYVAFLSNEMLEILFDKYYQINLKLATTLINNFSLKMLKLDHALEWIHVNASQTLFKQGEPANGIYIILNGRLRQYQYELTSNTPQQQSFNSFDQVDTPRSRVIGELAQGESFGEVEVLTAMNRSSTMVAVRDTELARLPRSLFEILATEHPSIVIRVSRMVVKKLLISNQTHPGVDPSITKIASLSSSSSSSLFNSGNKYNLQLLNTSSPSHHHSYSQTPPISTQLNSKDVTYRTITILPITNGLPVESFAMKLVNAFKQVGKDTIGLTQRTTLLHLGKHAFDKLSKLKQSGYFADLEHSYNLVVYIADTTVNSSWTRTCIDQGDCILLLADANSNCQIGEYENLLLRSKTSARTELILLHNERFVEPGLTHKWLSNRPWVDCHHHIQFETNILTRNVSKSGHFLNQNGISLLDKITQTELGRRTKKISRLLPDSIKNTMGHFSSRFMKRKRQIYNPIHSHKNDFLRLARILSGQAVGLVLGGGGARGISHLGILQAIEEQGIPIDVIGGTSIGSFIGGIYAKDYDVVPIYGRIKKFAGRISSIWRMLSDLTWPVTSYTTGHEFNRGIWKTFGDTRIEDFWIQYYCNSTNITESVQEIHSFGYAWRYIRASMSLAGLLPPLEENGSMLLDGGYVDNLPVDEMRARGCKTIFAVDVGSVDDKTPMTYGDSLNGFWIVFNRWNPFSSHPNIPNMAEIQMRLGYVASVNALEKAKHTPGVIYARPPIDEFNTLDFAKFEEIYQVGVQYGRLFFQDLIENERMPFIPGSKKNLADDNEPRYLLYRRNSI